MTEKIREYKMNGSLIIGVDAGYGNFKTARRVFPTAVSVSDKAPVFARDFIEWNGRYYIIGEGHKGFVTDKVTDDDNYVLTMAAVVKELEARGYTESGEDILDLVNHAVEDTGKVPKEYKQQMKNWIHDLVSTMSVKGWNNVSDMTLSILYGKGGLKDMKQLISYQCDADNRKRAWYSVT